MEQAITSAGEDAPAPTLNQALAGHQQRISLSFAAYLASSAVVALAWLQQWLPWYVLVMYVATGVLIHSAFMLLAMLGARLTQRDAVLTTSLLVACLVPPLIATSLLEEGQVQGMFLLLAAAPLLAAHWYAQHLQHQRPWRDHETLQQTVATLQAELDDARCLVNRDALTGVFSRPHLFETLSREAARQTRAKGVFSIALLDIDHFRQVNRQHGYKAGDAVLRAIASDINSKLRAADVFGRYGEEAFLLIMPNTALEGALIKAGRIHEQIAQLTVKIKSMDEGKEKDGLLKVSASIGVTTFCQGESFEMTLARVESALQTARVDGPNRITSLPQIEAPQDA